MVCPHIKEGVNIMYEEILSECDRLERLSKKYKKKCQTTYNSFLKDVVRTEYARGGKTIHRGYYCPSPVFDIMVGGESRGKLVNNLGLLKKKPDYEFGFDSDNKLVVIQNNFYKEFIIREEENTELGIMFSKYDVDVVSECKYIANQIQSYIHGLLFEGKITEYRKETYKYGEDGLKILDLYIFNNYIQQVYQHERYEFTHKDGYLNQYKQIPCDDPLIKNLHPIPDWSYNVRIKRKV